MEQKIEIYPTRRIYEEKSLNIFSNANIGKRNKELINSFKNHLLAIGNGNSRCSKLITQLRLVCESSKKDLDKLTKTDLENIIGLINLSSRSEATKSDYRRCIKQFYKWFKDEDKRFDSKDIVISKEAIRFYDYLEKNVKRAYKQKQIDPATIVTEDEINIVLIKGCNTAKQRAFISLLHETGVRIGEMLNVKLKDVVIKETHGEFFVNGKTGMRVVYFLKSIPYLKEYMQHHQKIDNRDSYLWLSDSGTRKGEPLLYHGAKGLICECFKKSGLNKKHNLHWFRHSRASLDIQKYTDQIMNKKMGWAIGSNQIKTYAHLNKKQVEDAFLEANGIVKDINKKKATTKCICNFVNDSASEYCHNCFRPLNVDVAKRDEERFSKEMSETLKEFMKVMSDPITREKFQAFMINQK